MVLYSKYGMVWCVVWCGVVWCAVVCCGVVWCGVVWYDMAHCVWRCLAPMVCSSLLCCAML